MGPSRILGRACDRYVIYEDLSTGKKSEGFWAGFDQVV
jgi:hypothetical protein